MATIDNSPESVTAVAQDEDPELRAMSAVYAALRQLDSDAQIRVLEYVERRLKLSRGFSSEDKLTDRSGNRHVDTPAADHADAGMEPPHNEDGEGGLEGISPVASKWMRRNGLTSSSLSKLFSLGVDEIDLVATKIPGASSRERLRHVLLLLGVASYLSGGVARIDSEKLREAERHYDADAKGNFVKYLKSWASEVSGGRASADLTLTTRGLNSATELIRQMI